MSNATEATSAELFRRCTCVSAEGDELEYFVFPKDLQSCERAVVYIHGLVSDLSWFRVPEELPESTAIVFLPRQPRAHVERFETWRDHYDCCVRDFRAHNDCNFLHLVAQCFGTMPAMHLAVTRPETFDTITLACPPARLRQEFSVAKKLRILFGRAQGEVHCELTPRSYGRSPRMTRFIEENRNVRWTFSNAFYRQTNALRNWLRRYVLSYPAPTHQILSSEDAVAVPEPEFIGGHHAQVPDQITTMQSDHFCELLPAKRQFWRSVVEFQLQNEPRLEWDGEISSVLVTGATGFVGTHVVGRLAEKGHQVVALVRDEQRARQHFSGVPKVELRVGQLDDLPSLERALMGIDAVVHLAGHVSDWDTADAFEKTNVQGTQNLLFMAHEAGVRQFVHISSLGVFGDTDQNRIDENNQFRLSSDNYSNSKIYAEIAVRRYCREHQLPFTIIRPGFVYGEGDQKFLPRLIERIKTGKFSYVGSRENCVNTVYVGNVAEMVAAAVGNPAAGGETYNLADPQETTIEQFNDCICEVLNLDKPTRVLKKQVALGVATVLESLFRTLRLKSPPPVTRKQVTFVARSRSVDSSKAYALIGREPYSFADGMKRTLEAMHNS